MFRKTIIPIILGIVLISLISAYYPGETIYAGETIIEPHDLGTENLIYTIIDNSSELIILPNVTINSTIIQIYFPTNMPPNSFTIVFLEEQTNEVVKVIYSGGGGGGSSHTRTKIIEKNITKFVDKEVIKYKDLEPINFNKEIIEKIPVSVYIFLGFLFLVFIGLFVRLYFLKKQSEKK